MSMPLRSKVESVIPYLERSISRFVMLPGETREDLLGAAIEFCVAAIIRNQEMKRDVGPFAVAKYALLRVKCGRRPWSNGETDVYDPRAVFQGKTRTTGISTPLGNDGGGDCSFEDVLSADCPDPSDVAADRIDSEEFEKRLDHFQSLVLDSLSEGRSRREIAESLGVRPSRVSQIIRELRDEIEDFFQVESERELRELPVWRRWLVSGREQRLAKDQRRREGIERQYEAFRLEKAKNGTEG
jgi:hypothetical protein